MPISVEEYLRRTEKPYCEYVDGGLLDKQGVKALAEVHCRLSPMKYFIPDVIAAPTVQGPYPTEPVFPCVEILSPEDRVGATLAKCEQYRAWGVPFCCVIDPEKRPPGNTTLEATLWTSPAPVFSPPAI